MTIAELEQEIATLETQISLAERKVAKELKNQVKEKKALLKDLIKKDEENKLGCTNFFKEIYEYASLELNTSVEQVHFQAKEMKDGKIYIFVIYDDFEFCKVYATLVDFNNPFADWFRMMEGSFSISIDTINRIRKLSAKPGKTKSPKEVVTSIGTTQAEYRIFGSTFIGENNSGEDFSIIIKRGSKQHSERIRKFVPAKWLYDDGMPVPWLLQSDNFKAYLTDDEKITDKETDNKIIELGKKNILVEIKEAKTPSYHLFMTEPSEKNIRYVMLLGNSKDNRLSITQVMKALATKKRN